MSYGKDTQKTKNDSFPIGIKLNGVEGMFFTKEQVVGINLNTLKRIQLEKDNYELLKYKNYVNDSIIPAFNVAIETSKKIESLNTSIIQSKNSIIELVKESNEKTEKLYNDKIKQQQKKTMKLYLSIGGAMFTLGVITTTIVAIKLLK